MKVKFGRMDCETCGSQVVVRKNEHGTLSYGCDECDSAPYVRSGTGAHAVWMKKLKLIEQAADPAGDQPEVKTPEVKQTKAAAGLWG